MPNIHTNTIEENMIEVKTKPNLSTRWTYWIMKGVSMNTSTGEARAQANKEIIIQDAHIWTQVYYELKSRLT